MSAPTQQDSESHGRRARLQRTIDRLQSPPEPSRHRLSLIVIGSKGTSCRLSSLACRLVVAAAFRTRRRGRARLKKPASPRRQALRNARNAARTSGLTRKAAVAGPGALQTRTLPAVWPRGGRSGAGPKSCARAARGRCGPRLRPRPCCGGPSNVPGHRRAAGAPALARDLPLST